MADLSAVLRKTIDGLPKATPQLRAKVYEKARAAILRQIETANPPLSEDVIEARRSAIEDAIDRTEDHYLERDAAESPAASDMSQPFESAVQRQPPASLPHVDRGPRLDAEQPSAAIQKPAWPKAGSDGRAAAAAAGMSGFTRGTSPLRRDPVPGERAAPPVERDAGPRPSSAPAAAKRSEQDRREPVMGGAAQAVGSRPDDASAFDSSAIPAADLAAPRYGNARREAKAKPARSRAPIFAGLAVLLLGGGAALAYVYQDEAQALFAGLSGPSTPAATGSGATATSAGTGATTTTTGAAPATGASGTAATPAQTSNRRFTQRLLPNGSEIDEGPGAGISNAFEEGTDVAAASPETLNGTTPQDLQPDATVPETAGVEPDVAIDPNTDTAAAEPTPSVPNAATPPASTPATAATGAASGVPAVAQKAVFYEERSDSSPGTQETGNVVWSVVNEPPSDGAPAEPAIRAVADVPEQNMKLTMTIRRNADATLPASHVIELMFDVPPNFSGGEIANVQRLALKPTEEARGEPLIGVAGKISDGFFIIALNNLAQATKTNLDLMGKEQWIDIPLAYSSGRRALISIEKGIPGDRVFQQAMSAWAAKT